MDVTVRSYEPSDAEALAAIFHRGVHEGAAAHYSESQRDAWSPSVPGGPGWSERLARGEIFVAEVGDRAAGFMTIDLGRGYLDLAYVLPELMGTGVADAIYAVVECRARAEGIPDLTTDASLVAEKFFERNGWHVTKRQEISRNGVVLKNARMQKSLRNEEAAA